VSEPAKEETRSANPDGTTKFMRPLPGANRMYPETDIPPVQITPKYLSEIKRSLPEPLTKKLHNFQTKFKLSPQLAREILGSDYLEIFEKTAKHAEPSLVASIYTSIVKDLERSGVKVSNITQGNFIDLFENLAKKKITKEAVPEILKALAQNNMQKVSDIAKRLGFTAMTEAEIEKIIRETVKPNIGFEKAVGIVMSQVRGKADAQTVIKLVKKFLK